MVSHWLEKIMYLSLAIDFTRMLQVKWRQRGLVDFLRGTCNPCLEVFQNANKEVLMDRCLIDRIVGSGFTSRVTVTIGQTYI